MPSFTPPLAEFRFLLRDVLRYDEQVTRLPGCADASLDLVLAVLDNAGRFARELLVPINLPGDAEGCHWTADGVRTPKGYRAAYQAFCRDGWPSLAGDPDFGGQGLPASLALFVREFIASGSMAFGMYAGLSQGACRAIAAHGSEALKQRFLPKLVDGSWTGTMCLTEPEAGSDLSNLRTKAVPDRDGDGDAYRITGTKIFISGGEHDLADNIVHLVLARLPDAPPGTRGISLFAVPKRIDGQANGVVCTAVEHKMGIRASATAALAFEGARGWLVGEPHGGLKAMFTMMNASRVGVAVQSLGAAELALQNARLYANERRQGRAPGSNSRPGQADPIVMHPDVRRNLLEMKAWVEGCRALYAQAAIGLDVRARHPDAAVRADAEARLALMTPVLKAFVSDCAVRVTQLGMTIHGGHGYVHENGVEQLVRDASIVPLYEGTNGIQALDLLHRKLAADEGAAARAFIAACRRGADEAQQDAALAPLTTRLLESLVHLEASTALMLERARQDAALAAAGASGYLRLLGLVAGGDAWLRMTAAARRGQREDGEEGAAFYTGKLTTAAFYMTHLLAESALLAATIRDGSALVAEAVAEQL